MSEVNLSGTNPVFRSQVLEAVFEFCTRTIELGGDPEKVSSAYLLRGRLSLVRGDYEAAASDFSKAPHGGGSAGLKAIDELGRLWRQGFIERPIGPEEQQASL